jgi:protease-4
MRFFSALGRLLTSWYVVVPFFAAVGIAVGVVIFVFAYPGKPKIGVIDIPFTVITEGSSWAISEYLNYARRDDSIKAVVIKLSTPGGGAASSERLYIETRQLREEKPVVLVMNGLVASGGYMMAMGASHSYAQTSSLVGNVGVISFAGPLISPVPDERLIYTGPYKLTGASRRDWIGTMDQLKRSFAQMVVNERGDKLKISQNELVEGRIYSGVEAVRLGLADEVGGDAHALDKAAELAGISNYSLVDVNVEVQREFIRKIRRIFSSLDNGDNSDLTDAIALMAADRSLGDPALAASGLETDPGIARLQALRGLIHAGSVGANQEEPFPDFPLDIRRPNVYYLYVGHDP